jgi:hypothetical protein
LSASSCVKPIVVPFGAADLDVEPAPGFAPDGVGVIDGPQIPCLDAELRDVLRDGDHVELMVCDARHW